MLRVHDWAWASAALLLLLAFLGVPVILGSRGAAAGAPASAPSSATSPPPTTIGGTLGSVYMYPSGLASVTPCDKSVARAAGCNSYLVNDSAWAQYEAQGASDLSQISFSLGNHPNGSVILYAPAYLFDVGGPFGSAPSTRFEAVVDDAIAAGLRPLLFFGSPEFFGSGTGSETHDVVHNATALAYLYRCLAAAMALPSVRAHVAFASLYWMGGSSYCGSGKCSGADIAAYTSATARAVLEGGGSGVSFLQHLDGTFWDACWPQPCPTWNFNGYSPTSLLASTGLAGLMAESWTMGSLEGGVRTLLNLGVVQADELLLLCDVPNCDLFPKEVPCSTGSLEGDSSAWFASVARSGVANGTWGVWDSIDCGILDGDNYYGDIYPNGSTLTPKGELHRAQALQAAARG